MENETEKICTMGARNWSQSCIICIYNSITQKWGVIVSMFHTIRGGYRYIATGGAPRLPEEGDAPEWTVRLEGAKHYHVGGMGHVGGM